MMHIFVVAQGMPEKGGAELRAFRHTQYLRSRAGTDACLIAPQGERGRVAQQPLPDYVYPLRLAVPDIHGGPAWLQMFKLGLHLFELGFRFGWFLFSKRDEFDILQVICSSSWSNLMAIYIGKLLGKPVIAEMVILGSDDPLSLNRRERQEGRQLFPHRPLKYRLFLKADAYVSKSPPISQAYLQAGLPERRLFQIASAVDTQRFRPAENETEKNALRAKLGLEVDGPLLLFAGRIHPVKGLHWLLPAFSQVLGCYPDVHLVILGPVGVNSAEYAHELQDEALAQGLVDRVKFTGRVENVQDYMRAADIFVLPTQHEGFSGAILEAMACGLALVASDIPEIALAQVEDGVEGRLTKVGDVQTLAETIIELINDPGLRARLGRAARQRVEREFTFDAVGAQYLRLYEHLLEAKSA